MCKRRIQGQRKIDNWGQIFIYSCSQTLKGEEISNEWLWIFAPVIIDLLPPLEKYMQGIIYYEFGVQSIPW
jgi:hypothetical protein